MRTIPSGTIKILSIDGGGIRGIIPAIILDALQIQIGVDLHTVFDLISGTSTGGIIALGIGADIQGRRPYTPAELVESIREKRPGDFSQALVPAPARVIRSKILARGPRIVPLTIFR